MPATQKNFIAVKTLVKDIPIKSKTVSTAKNFSILEQKLAEMRQQFGYNELMEAIKNQTNPKISNLYDIPQLLKATKDLDVRDKKNNTVLMLACQYNPNWVIPILNKMNKKEILNSINIKNTDGDSALMFLVQSSNSNSLSLIEPLIQAGAKVNDKDSVGSNLLAQATLRCNLEAVHILLEKGADINSIDNHGFTPLMRAMTYTANDISKPLVMAILKYHPDLTLRNRDNDTALTIAKRTNPDLVEVLLTYAKYLVAHKEEEKLKNVVENNIDGEYTHHSSTNPTKIKML